MIRRLAIAFTALLSFASPHAFAHEGHDHDEESLTDRQVAQLAAKALPSLVKAKKVDAAWAKAQREDVTIKTEAGKDFWVVAYKNPDGKVSNGKPLYLIFDDLGNFVDANHTATLAAK